MRRLLFTVACALLTQFAVGAAPLQRLQGLDRLYFERVGVPGEPVTIPRAIAKFLPEFVLPVKAPAKSSTHTVRQETRVTIHDFPLRGKDLPRALFLRQIVLIEATARISELWWALYDGGHRSDTWYFKADPTRTESKALSNYEIESVLVSANGRVDVKVKGEMFRPRGAWWIVGKDFSFLLDADKLTLNRVENVFGYFQDYDLGRDTPPISVSVEREVGARFETRKYNAVPDTVLRGCGFRDPVSDDGWEFDWRELEKVANCIAGGGAARQYYRDLNQPSFVERGGPAVD